jgi:hypothetical protein
MTEPYSEELADQICDLVGDGLSLRATCEKLGIPLRTVRSWIARRTDFAAGYDAARKLAIDGAVDSIIELAQSVRGTDSNAVVQAARLEIDSVRWLAAKLLPERFGDKLTSEISGPGGTPLIPERSADPTRVAHALMLLLSSIPRKPNRDDTEMINEQEVAALPAPDPDPAAGIVYISNSATEYRPAPEPVLVQAPLPQRPADNPEWQRRLSNDRERRRIQGLMSGSQQEGK